MARVLDLSAFGDLAVNIVSESGPLGADAHASLCDQVEAALDDHPFDQYRLYPATSRDAWKRHLVDRLRARLEDTEWVWFFEVEQGAPALLGCRIPSWDEDHFGIRMAHLGIWVCRGDAGAARAVDRMLARCLEGLGALGVEFASARIHGDDIRSLHVFEERGFRYYEDIIWPVAECGRGAVPPGVRLAREEDLDRIRWIAANCQYQRGHYHCDDGFDRELVDAMYAKWVQTAWDKGDPIAVIESDDRVAGYFVFLLNEPLSKALGHAYGGMRSLALDGAFRGQGLGRRLFDGTIALMRDRGARFVESGYATKNHTSAAFHAANGFFSVYEEVTLHRWLRRPG